MNRILEKNRRFLRRNLLFVTIFVLNISYADDFQWWLSTTGQTSKGNYIFESKSRSEYILFGLTGRGERWSLSVNVPLISQKNGKYTQISEVIIETGGIDSTGNDNWGHMDDDGGMGGGHMGDGGNMGDDNPGNDSVTEVMQIEEVISPERQTGIGDIYLYGNYKLIGKTNNYSGLYLNTQIKIPVANVDKGLGTGKIDYGFNISFKKAIKTFSVFGDVGYLVLGDPKDISYIDPYTLGLGVGKSIRNGKYYALAYYQQYSVIYKNYEPPRQFTLGLNYKINSRFFVSGNWIKGFSETSPDNGLRVGIQIGL